MALTGSEVRTGAVAGSAVFTGPATGATIDLSSDPACGAATRPDDALLVAPANQGLANVVVQLIGGPAEEGTSVSTTAPVQVSQRGCAYVPRVSVARQGRPVEVTNADPVLHNLHGYAGRKGLFNRPQPVGSAPLVETVPKGLEILRLRCDVHPWMTGWVVFSEGRHFALTAKDGSFTIPAVPPGTYILRTWHEMLGMHDLPVTVVGDKVTDVRLQLTGQGELQWSEGAVPLRSEAASSPVFRADEVAPSGASPASKTPR